MTGGGAERAGEPRLATRRSPLLFFHGLWFVLGGGPLVLWSWWGAVLAILAVMSAWIIARALLSPTKINDTKAALDAWAGELTELRAAAEHPGENPEADRRAVRFLRDRGLLDTDDQHGGAEPGREPREEPPAS